MPGKRSRDKGKRGEREAAEIFRAAGLTVARGQQAGAYDTDADIIVSSDNLVMAVEVKRTAGTPPIKKAWGQAVDAAKDEQIPCVVFRWDNGEWLLTLRAEDAIKILGMNRGGEHVG